MSLFEGKYKGISTNCFFCVSLLRQNAHLLK